MTCLRSGPLGTCGRHPPEGIGPAEGGTAHCGPNFWVSAVADGAVRASSGHRQCLD